MLIDLVFESVSGKLWGPLLSLKESEAIDAGSGGRAGQFVSAQNPHKPDWLKQNNPIFSGVKHSPEQVGGTIPTGYYYMCAKEGSKKAGFPRIWLTDVRLAKKGKDGKVNMPLGMASLGRTALQIHGRGQQGSVGCIVIETTKAVELFDAVRAVHAERSKCPILRVRSDKPLDIEKSRQTLEVIDRIRSTA